MRIAVIGSGIAGLEAARELAVQHQVCLYEREARPGGHSHTVTAGPEKMAVDTGFIVYNERNYPGLTRLFGELGVPTRASDMSFAASINGGALEYAGDSLATLFAQRRNLVSPAHWGMLADILRFNRDARAYLAAGGPELTLGEFLDRGGYGERLRSAYLLPMGAAIWSCPVAAMLGFPARSFLRFFDNHSLLDLRGRPQWRTVTGGSRVYVQRLLQAFPGELRLATPVARIRREHGAVTVIDGHGHRDRFDRVVIAAHADQALAMLESPDWREREVLGAFPYQRNRVVLHSDPALMPRRRSVWSSWNYLRDGGQEAQSRVSVSYWMNRLQALPGDRNWFVSLNPLREPDPQKVWFETGYRHPVFTAEAVAMQARLPEIQGRDRIWFCGAWCGYGFHEDGLQAGLAAARDIAAAPAVRHRVAERGTREALRA